MFHPKFEDLDSEVKKKWALEYEEYVKSKRKNKGRC